MAPQRTERKFLPLEGDSHPLGPLDPNKFNKIEENLSARKGEVLAGTNPSKSLETNQLAALADRKGDVGRHCFSVPLTRYYQSLGGLVRLRLAFQGCIQPYYAVDYRLNVQVFCLITGFLPNNSRLIGTNWNHNRLIKSQ